MQQNSGTNHTTTVNPEWPVHKVSDYIWDCKMVFKTLLPDMLQQEGMWRSCTLLSYSPWWRTSYSHPDHSGGLGGDRELAGLGCPGGNMHYIINNYGGNDVMY